MFQSGDRFQQAQAARAIMRAAGGGRVADTEVRRAMGLFANLRGERPSDRAISGEGYAMMGGGEGLVEYFRKIDPQFAKSLGVSGADIISNIFKEARKSTIGLSTGQRAFEFMSRIGMMNQGGLELYRMAEEGGGRVTEEQAKGVFEKQKAEEEKLYRATLEIKDILRAQMFGYPSRVELMASRVGSVIEDMSREVIMKPLLRIEEKLPDFGNMADNFTRDLKRTLKIEDKPLPKLGTVEEVSKFLQETREESRKMWTKELWGMISEGLSSVGADKFSELAKKTGDLIISLDGNKDAIEDNTRKVIKNPERGGRYLNTPIGIGKGNYRGLRMGGTGGGE